MKKTANLFVAAAITAGAVVAGLPTALADEATTLEKPAGDAQEQADVVAQDLPAEGAQILGQKYDLRPEIRVAGGKVPGFAGLVSVSAANVGSETYYQEFPNTTFRIEVHTEEGPEGVDRLITPGYFNGAYTRDLGFDRATSTRTFEVTLSNPIEPGEGKLIANLNFGDGLTKKGRLVNYITVTQVGRMEEDKSTDNDQQVDSREVTKTDLGKPNKGLF